MTPPTWDGVVGGSIDRVLRLPLYWGRGREGGGVRGVGERMGAHTVLVTNAFTSMCVIRIACQHKILK